MGNVQRRPRRRRVRRGRHALVQRHHDVAADGLLGVDAAFGAEQDRLPVGVALEHGPGFRHRARMRQRENLEPAGVGEDALRPAHEFVDAPQPPEHLRSRPQQQVVRVG